MSERLAQVRCPATRLPGVEMNQGSTCLSHVQRPTPLSHSITQTVGNIIKVRTLDIAPLRETSPQKRSGMAHVSRYLTVLPAHPHVLPHSA